MGDDLVAGDFDRSVFINCPFDNDFAPILQAILFTVVYLGLRPRIASESNDGGAVRLHKIQDLIEQSKYSIHDLSRCQATAKGEYYRLNMPFELGLDYGCRQYRAGPQAAKKLLILEEKSYRYQASLSDLAGCDIKTHGANYQAAIRQVRNWLVSEAGLNNAKGAALIHGAYIDFQQWNYATKLADGFSEDDIQDYPTSELLTSMTDWIALGKPV